MRLETTYDDHVAQGTNMLARIGLNVISGTANIAKTGVLMVGGVVTTAMTVDTYAFFKYGMDEMGDFFRFNDCKVPMPTIINILTMERRGGCADHINAIAEKFFQYQALLIPVVITSAALTYMVFNKIDNGTDRLEKKLFGA